MTSKALLVKEWQTKADRDLATIKVLIKSPDSPGEIIAFHCQQAIEKYLKSFLFMKEVTIPKTHDLDLLFRLCLKEEKNLNILDRALISSMTDFAVDSRYPGEQYVPSDEEISKYLILVKQVQEFIKKITK